MVGTLRYISSWIRLEPLVALFVIAPNIASGVPSPSCLKTCAEERLKAEECSKRCESELPVKPGSSVGLPDNVHVIARQTQNIVFTGTQSYYGGVVQIAAGITQVSEAAQAKSNSQQTEATNQRLVAGLTNIASGTEAVEQARGIIDHANTLEQRQARSASVGAVVGAKEWGLLFEREKAGRTANSILDRMDEVAKVSADELIEKVNGGENVYNVAAKAKGLDMTGEELASLVASATEKAGKPTNPEVAPGVKMTDLMKDMDMFLGKGGSVAASSKEGNEAAAKATHAAVRQPAQEAAASANAPASETAVAEPENIQPAESGELMASILPGGEVSLFAQIRKQYQKRQKWLGRGAP